MSLIIPPDSPLAARPYVPRYRTSRIKFVTAFAAGALFAGALSALPPGSSSERNPSERTVTEGMALVASEPGETKVAPEAQAAKAISQPPRQEPATNQKHPADAAAQKVAAAPAKNDEPKSPEAADTAGEAVPTPAPRPSKADVVEAAPKPAPADLPRVRSSLRSKTKQSVAKRSNRVAQRERATEGRAAERWVDRRSWRGERDYDSDSRDDWRRYRQSYRGPYVRDRYRWDDGPDLYARREYREEPRENRRGGYGRPSGGMPFFFFD